jgi:ribonuclease P protein component
MSRAVFTSQQKLTKAIEFKRVFRKPVVSSDACFKVLARVGQENNARLGMAVSRQIDKKAVGRNRIKRVIRESFRQRFSGHGVRVDIVVLPRREAASIANKDLFRSLLSHWSRLESRFEG